MSTKNNRTRPVNVICATFFVGIVLTFTLFFGITAMTSRAQPEADDSTANMTFRRFSEVFYNNEKLSGLNDSIEYLLFGSIGSDDIILGDDGFLFDAGSNSTGYNYVRDYVGAINLTQSELEVFSNVLRLRQLAYKNRGVDYMLVVIPNAQTVYSDKMPAYMGSISEKTMLRQLSAYLAAEGCDYFYDATDLLTTAKDYGRLLYNNTEDSLNCLGEWYLYDAVCDRLEALYGIRAQNVGISSLSLYSRSSDGKELARRAGLASVIPNETISLSDSMQNKYSVSSYYGTMLRTEFTSAYADEVSDTVLLEFTDEWDRVLLMPYFSNTFSEVAYKSNHQFSGLTIDNLEPSVVVQFIHEYELYELLDSNTLLTYNASLRLSLSDDVTAQPLLLSQCSIDDHTVCVGGEVEKGALVTVKVDGQVVSEDYAIEKLFFISVDLGERSSVSVSITAKVEDKEQSSPIELRLYRNSDAKHRTVSVGSNSQLYSSDYSWLTEPSDAQIEAIRQTLADKVSRAKQLTGKNTEYVYVIVPDKLNVYPEDAPDDLVNLLPALNRYTEAVKSVRGGAGMKVIDLTEEMKSHRALESLYSQTDMMLTGFGSYVVYHSLASYVAQRFPSVEVHELMDFSAGTEINVGGELVSRLGLDAAVISETVLTLNPTFSARARFEQSGGGALDKTQAFISYTDDSTLPVAIISRDAYGTEMLETLAEHFSKMIVLREGEYTVSDELIAEIKPDYIITVRCNGELS